MIDVTIIDAVTPAGDRDATDATDATTNQNAEKMMVVATAGHDVAATNMVRRR